MKRLTMATGFVAVACFGTSADAFVPVPVGGHPGEVDVNVRVGFELGKVEPTENQDSWRKSNWQVYQVGGGYTYGTIGPFQDTFFRLDNTFYNSPAETSNPEDLVDPDSPQPAECLGVQKSGYCEFYPSDKGWLIQPSIGANLVHEADYSFGLFLQGTVPVGVNLERFQLPRIDYFAGGTQLGVHITPWLGYSSRMYVGSGAFGGDHTQNAGVVLTNLFVLEAREWLLPWKIGVSFGPYFEGDLTEREDPIYDAAYSPPGRTDPIRSIKFGTVVSPYVQITEYVALEAGYLQKFFGDDAQATQFWYAGARAAL